MTNKELTEREPELIALIRKNNAELSEQVRKLEIATQKTISSINEFVESMEKLNRSIEWPVKKTRVERGFGY